MIYYIANNAIILPGDKRWVYEKFQQQLLGSSNSVPDSYKFMIDETWKHIYMENCLDRKILVKHELYKRLLEDISTIGSWNAGYTTSSKKFDLLKVLVCDAILNEDEEQLEDVRACFLKMYEDFQTLTPNKVFLWYFHLVNTKTRKRADRRKNLMVISRDVGRNKISAYKRIEDKIIKKMEEACPKEDLNMLGVNGK